jgi:hypothetical protein
MKQVAVAAILILLLLHQDFWWWDDRTIILGFLPVGLAWHAGISLAAAASWWLVVKTCWPRELEGDEDERSWRS